MVRPGSAKALCVGSIPTLASLCKSEGRRLKDEVSKERGWFGISSGVGKENVLRSKDRLFIGRS